MRIHLVALALMLGAAVPATAADAVVEEVAVEVAPVFVWTGGYIGLQGGYAWGQSHYVVPSNGVYLDPDPDGWLGGVYGGFNYQLSNNVVLGIEGDFAFANVEGDGLLYDAAGVLIPDFSTHAEMNWSGAVRGRIGYAFDRFLPYVAAGLAFAEYDHQLLNEGSPFFDLSETYTGWTIGAGLEYALTDNVLLRGEYRYTDFGSEYYPYDTRTAAAEHDLDLSTNDVRFGIAFKF